MKTKEQIQEAIEKIKEDPKMKKVATIDVNAPLALIQSTLEGQMQALKWVLSE